MKVAVCFYGLYRRGIELYLPYLRHIFEPLDPDLFICTTGLVFAPLDQDVIYGCRHRIVLPQDEIELNYGKYLRKFLILPYNPDHYKRIVADNNLPEKTFQDQLLWRTLSMFDHIKQVIRVRKEYEQENGIKYDAVVLCRPDLKSKNAIDISNLDLKHLYFAGFHVGPVFLNDTTRENVLGISDHIMVSKPENIDLLGGIFDRIPTLKHWAKHQICNETLIGKTLIENGIEFHQANFIDCDVLRGV